MQCTDVIDMRPRVCVWQQIEYDIHFHDAEIQAWLESAQWADAEPQLNIRVYPLVSMASGVFLSTAPHTINVMQIHWIGI